MEIKVFLDTNILFDMIDVPRPNSKNVKKLFALSTEKNLSFFISAITINIIVYVMQNRFNMKANDLKVKLKKLYQTIEIVPYDMEVITDGLKLDFTDIYSKQLQSHEKCATRRWRVAILFIVLIIGYL